MEIPGFPSCSHPPFLTILPTVFGNVLSANHLGHQTVLALCSIWGILLEGERQFQGTQVTLMTKMSHPRRDLIIITSTIPCYPVTKGRSLVSCSVPSHQPITIGGQVSRAGLPKNILAQSEMTEVVSLTPPYWEGTSLLIKSSVLNCWDEITS